MVSVASRGNRWLTTVPRPEAGPVLGAGSNSRLGYSDMKMPRDKRPLVLGVCLVSLLLGSWAGAAEPFSEEPPDPTGHLKARALDATKLRSAVSDLAANASEAEVSRALQTLLPDLLGASMGDAQTVLEVLRNLGKQPQAVPALAQSYRKLAPQAFQERLFTLGLVGELKRADALPFLREVISAPLPAKDGRKAAAELLSPRELEEMIQAKAVQGLAYLTTKEADAAAREVMLEHESMHVRQTAIDAYMFNHKDSPEAAKELYAILPQELHPFVERPRFHAGTDPEEFSERLKAWQEKWGSRGLPE